MTYYNECICECGDLRCVGVLWCERCAEFHHGEPCEPEAPDNQDGLTLEQAALDADQFPDAATYQERHWSDRHFVGMY